MSLFSPRVITYRASRDFTGEPAMAVVIQQMVNSEKAGVAFTADPSNGAQDRVVIEGAFGLGEVVVSGEVEPDTYIVVQGNPRSARRPASGTRPFKIVRGPDGHDKVVDLDDQQADARVLDDTELKRIAELAISTERHNGCPQDTEWAISQRRDVPGAGQADHDVASHGGADFRQTRGVGPRTGRGAGNGAGQGARARNPRRRRRGYSRARFSSRR